MGSREGVEDEDGVRLICIQGSPSRVGELSRGDVAPFSESEIAEGEDGCGGVRHVEKKTLNSIF